MLRAALLMCLAMTLIPLGDSAGKALTAGGVPPIFVAWTRFALGALLLIPFLSRRHFSPVALIDPRLIFRGLLITGAILSILTALKTEPLPNVFGAFFIGPLLSYVLSAWLLRERVTVPRSALVVLGFLGVLLIVRPGFGMTPGLGFALLAGVLYGSFLTASRWLSTAAPPRTLMLSQLLTGAVVLAPFGLTAIPTLSVPVGALVVVSAAASMAGNLLLIVAYKLAPATRLAPFVYFQIFAATGFGWLFFSDVPDVLTWAGLALITGAGFAALALRR